MTLRVTLLLLPLAIAGCSKPAGPTASSAPVPPLSPAVRDAALQRGRAIAAETFSLLSSNLQSAIQSGGISNALPFCSLAASPLTAGVAEQQGVTLRRVTHRARNPENRADAVELGVLQSYEGAMEATGMTNPPPPLVTNLIAGKATFFAPILLSRELCLKCHGAPGRDVADADLAVIRRLYPHDQATGFRLGQLRGAWRIDLPIRSLVAAPADTPGADGANPL